MRIHLGSIGCRLNQSEIESLARRLASEGHCIALSPAESDICILNTCAVTRRAEAKSRQAARRCHRAAPHAAVFLTGCYATLFPAEARALPGVVRVVSNPEKASLHSTVGSLGGAGDGAQLGPQLRPGECGQLPGGRTRAFVKVQDGCDNHCTYCVTRVARGPGRSRGKAEVIAEIQALDAVGCQEVVLTGVHLGSYGPETSLRELVESILAHTSMARIRLSSLEPWDLEPSLFSLWQDPRLCRQLHLPLQSGSASVLRRMGRQVTPERYRALAAAALEAIPDLALTTDVMVGFPGETEQEFEDSLSFVRESRLARLHVFGYSSRPGTAAARMPGHLAPEVIRERSRLMRELGRQKQEQFMQRFRARAMEVLWESPAGDGLWRGHTDNYIQVTAASDVPLKNTRTQTLLTGLSLSGMRGRVMPETQEGA
jgi:threonylcarbamoyladenosine tRNA methylthiotransferase MtaB